MRAVLSIAFALSTLAVIAQTPVLKKTTPAPTVAPAANAKVAPVPAAASFVGNKDSKIFHTATCKIGAKMKVENKVVFASKDEALKAGFTPCKVCIKP
jgi:hypothetical protein